MPVEIGDGRNAVAHEFLLRVEGKTVGGPHAVAIQALGFGDDVDRATDGTGIERGAQLVDREDGRIQNLGRDHVQRVAGGNLAMQIGQAPHQTLRDAQLELRIAPQAEGADHSQHRGLADLGGGGQRLHRHTGDVVGMVERAVGHPAFRRGQTVAQTRQPFQNIVHRERELTRIVSLKDWTGSCPDGVRAPPGAGYRPRATRPLRKVSGPVTNLQRRRHNLPRALRLCRKREETHQ